MSESHEPTAEETVAIVNQMLIQIAGQATAAYRKTQDQRLEAVAKVARQQVSDSGLIDELLIAASAPTQGPSAPQTPAEKRDHYQEQQLAQWTQYMEMQKQNQEARSAINDQLTMLAMNLLKERIGDVNVGRNSEGTDSGDPVAGEAPGPVPVQNGPVPTNN